MVDTVQTTSVSIDGVTAGRHVRPTAADELASILRDADAAGEIVAPVGGGTQLDLGMPPRRVDIAVETTALNRVVEYEPADLTVTVEAGMRFADLQTVLNEQGQFLALDPPVDEAATIGGVIATNVSGPLRFSSGTARDLVIGTRVANTDGTVTRAGGRVVKNVAGYDLNKLYIGSLGTLGVTVELSFKLAPLPPSTATVVGTFESIDAVRAAVAAVVRSPLSPLAIEVLGPGATLADDRTCLVFRVGGYAPAVERQVRDLGALIDAHAGQRADIADSAWEDLARMRRDAQARPLVVKATAPLSLSTTLVEQLARELGPLNPTVWAHAGNGVAYAACDAPESADALKTLRKRISGLSENAALVVHRCPTALKSDLDVWGDPGASVGLMRAIKAKLDPHNTLNPGRYVGGM
ncbi:MAG: FAD-binding oxidoreductase [Chloroflexota bacterium]